MCRVVTMATAKSRISPPPTPPLKDITRDTPSPGSPKRELERPARPSSPDTCPICLDEFDESKDRAYSNNCYHIFCFECLLEWSNNKRECPLCKRPFKSIVHKFKDNGGHEVHQLPLLAPPTERVWDHAMSFEWMSRMRRQFIQHRHRHLERLRNSTARPSPLGVRNPTRPHTAESRRFIYRYELYCEGAPTPGGGARYRRTSPEFYRSNPATLHRLMPWLNRELVAVLPSRDNVDYVENHILAEIKRVNIRSETFRRSIQPFILQYTAHFIHEFYQFAISPYDMADFDRYARYPRRPPGARAGASVDIVLHPTTNPPSSSISNNESTEVEISIVPSRSTVSRATASTHTTSPMDSVYERRRWHRERLAEELASSVEQTTDLLSVPRRTSGFVLNVSDDMVATVSPRRRSGLILSSADGGIHPEISSSVSSSRRERLSNQQRMAMNRLERSMRLVDDADSGMHAVSRWADRPADSEVTDPRLSVRSRASSTTTSQLHLPLPHFASASDRTGNGSSSSSTVPRIVSRVRSFLDNIDDELSNDAAPNTRALSMPTYEELVGEPVVDPLTNSLETRTHTDSLFPFLRGSTSDSSSSLSANSSVDRPVRSPSPSLSSHSSDVILVGEEKPFRARTPIILTSSDSETDTRHNAISTTAIAGSRRLSSSSGDESSNEGYKDILEAKRSPAKRRKLNSLRVAPPSVETERAATSENIRVSSESNDSDCMVTFEATKPKKSNKHKHSHERREKKEASHSKARKESHRRKAGKQWFRGREVPPPEMFPNDRYAENSPPRLTGGEFWTHDSTSDKQNKQKKSKKRKASSKDSKHHKHVLAGMKGPAASTSFLSLDSTEDGASQSTDYTKDGAGQSTNYTRDGASQSTEHKMDRAGQSTDHKMESAGQSTERIIDRHSRLKSTPSPTNSIERYIAQSFCLDPYKMNVTSQSRTNVSHSPLMEPKASSSIQSNNSSRSSPLLDVTTVEAEASTGLALGESANGRETPLSSQSNEEMGQGSAADPWYLDYSRTDYMHPEGRRRKPSTDIRKQIRYFAKNKIAQKYDSKKYKKHDRGHKN